MIKFPPISELCVTVAGTDLEVGNPGRMASSDSLELLSMNCREKQWSAKKLADGDLWFFAFFLHGRVPFAAE